MMRYTEQDQKRILQMMDSDILALIVIDLNCDEFEVIYSDGSYNGYNPESIKSDFFGKWITEGINLVDPQDRERMMVEISKDHLLDYLESNDTYITICRFLIDGEPRYCRIKVKKDLMESGTLVVGIRNVDREIRQERERIIKEKKQKDEMDQLEDKLRQMRTRNFMSQMHPHFLYNALSSIREIVLTDPEYGADMLYDFTVHLRAGIRAMTSDEKIPFSQEMENIEAYVSIEKMRLGDRLSVEYDLAAEDFPVIPLSIQPIVENAIRHGIYESGCQDGLVTVRTAETEDSIIITVTDNGNGFDPEIIKSQAKTGKRDHAGLQNLIFRLENMMNASVDIQSKIGEGTRVEVVIPKGGGEPLRKR